MSAAAEIRRTFAVADRDGLHARPCTRVARTAAKFKCDLAAEWNGRRADARSVLDLLRLCAPHGAAVEFVARGADAAACLDAVGAAMAAETH